jgi:hypothetical protein
VPEKGCASAEGGHRSGPARASRLQQGRVRLQEFEPARTRHRLYSNLLKLACSRISPCMDVSFAAKCRHRRPPQSVGSRWLTQRQDTFDISYEHGDRKWAQHSCTVLPAAHYRQLRSAHLHAPDLPSTLSDMRLSSRKAWSGPPANDPTSFPGRSFILDGHS